MPTAIFAAVPRTTAQLSATLPTRSPSPLVQALGEVGVVGKAFVEPRVRSRSAEPRIATDAEEIAASSEKSAEAVTTTKDHNYAEPCEDTESVQDYDPHYEEVKRMSGEYDRRIVFKFEEMGNRPAQPLPQESSADPGVPDHEYHVLENPEEKAENPYKEEPAQGREHVYARVKKRGASGTQVSIRDRNFS